MSQPRNTRFAKPAYSAKKSATKAAPYVKPVYKTKTAQKKTISKTNVGNHHVIHYAHKAYQHARKMYHDKSGRNHHSGHKFGALAPRAGQKPTQIKIVDLQGRPEMEKVRLKYATTSSFTTDGITGAPSFLQIKANSIYRPYPGALDNDGGAATMWSLYTKCMVYASRIHLRLWSDTSGNQEPFRAVVNAVTPTQYTAFTGVSNIATLTDVANFKEALYSPGSSLLNLKDACYTSNIWSGTYENLETLVAYTSYSTIVNTDPVNLIYWLIGLQVMAGTTALNCQIEVNIEHDCLFYNPVATNQLQATHQTEAEAIAKFLDPTYVPDSSKVIKECQPEQIVGPESFSSLPPVRLGDKAPAATPSVNQNTIKIGDKIYTISDIKK